MDVRFILTIVVPFLLKAFLFLLVLAFGLWFRARGRTIAEAGVFATMGAVAVCSMGLNAAVVPGDFPLSALVWGVATGLGFLAVRRHWRIAGETASHWIRFTRAHSLPVSFLMIVFLFRGGWTMWMGGGGQLFPVPMDGSTSWLVGILKGAWVDVYGEMVSFFGYIAIILGTYALSRRHAWPPVALTATLVIGCMPRLSSPLGVPEVELTTGGYALLAVVALYRLLEEPRVDDLSFWIVGWVCSWTPVPMGWLLPAVLMGLSLILVHHRHGLEFLGRFAGSHKWMVLGAIGISVMISPFWHQIHSSGGHSMSPVFRYNSEGMNGAFHNLIRYCLQIAHLGTVEISVFKPFGIWWQKVLEGIPGVIRHVVRYGAEGSRFSLAGTGTGFGPLGIFLVVPATLYSLVRGSKRLRATAVAAIWYWFLLVLIPDWRVEQVYLLTPLMAVFGFLVAFFLPPWRFSGLGLRVLHLSCFLIWMFGFPG